MCSQVGLKNLPVKSPDSHARVTVIEFEFDKVPKFERGSMYPQLNNVGL